MKKSSLEKETSNKLIDGQKKDSSKINLKYNYLNEPILTETDINSNIFNELKNMKLSETKKNKRPAKSVKSRNKQTTTKNNINKSNYKTKKIIFPMPSTCALRQIISVKDTKTISNFNINQQRLTLNSEKYTSKNNTLNQSYTSNFFEIKLIESKKSKNNRNQPFNINKSFLDNNDGSEALFNKKTICNKNGSSNFKSNNFPPISNEKYMLIKQDKTNIRSSSDIFNNDNLNKKFTKTLYLSKSSKKSNVFVSSYNDSSSSSNQLIFFRNNRQNTLNLDVKNLNNKTLGTILEKEQKENNPHYLENTICAKNKIVKKYKNDNIMNKEDNNIYKKITSNNKKTCYDGGRCSLQKKVIKNLRINLLQSDEKNYKNKNQIINKISKEKLNYNQLYSTNKLSGVDIRVSNISTMSNNHIFNGKIDDYLITKELGRGTYAIVKLATHKITKQKYAMKVYTKELLLDPQKRNAVKNEVAVLKNLNHDNIMKLYEVIDTSNNLYLVLEYVNGLSLLDIINKETNRVIGQSRAIKLFSQIVNGIAYCHSKNIAHRDIKLENILVLKDDIIKIIDFGFSIKSNKETYHKLYCGTPSYMSPEMRNKEKYIAQYCDIWSLGVLFYAMLYGKFPFKDDDEITESKINIKFPDAINLDERIKNLFKKIFVFEPKNRIPPEEITNELKLIGLI